MPYYQNSVISEVLDSPLTGIKLKDISAGVHIKFQNNIYRKINKKSIGQGVTMKWRTGYSVLFNINTASLRQVDADETVTIMEGELKLWESERPSEYLR